MTAQHLNGSRGILIALLAALLIVCILAFIIWRGDGVGGRDWIQEQLFGEADLGSVDFMTLKRRETPNDALACPPGSCPLAKADFVTQDYPVPPARLRTIVTESAKNHPDTIQVFSDPTAMHDRFVARTRVFRFPDTVDALIIDRGQERSSLALYSRSKMGSTDIGVNRARVASWLEQIEKSAKP